MVGVFVLALREEWFEYNFNKAHVIYVTWGRWVHPRNSFFIPKKKKSNNHSIFIIIICFSELPGKNENFNHHFFYEWSSSNSHFSLQQKFKTHTHQTKRCFCASLHFSLYLSSEPQLPLQETLKDHSRSSPPTPPHRHSSEEPCPPSKPESL